MAMIAVLALVAALLTSSPAPAATVDALEQGPSTAVTSDPLPTAQIDGIVWEQAASATTVYAGGAFANARPAGSAPGQNLTPRANLLAYDLESGDLISSWDPVANGRVLALALSPDGSRLYVGGQFTSIDGQSRSRIAALDTATGAVISSWNPIVNSTVQDIVATDSTVYVVGEFSRVNGVARARIAALSASTGAVLPFNPILAGGYGVRAAVLSPDGSKLVIGGSFTSTNGSTDPGRGMAALNAQTGTSLPWAVNSVIRNAGTNAAIYSLASDGDSVYGSGYDFYGSDIDDGFEGAFRASWTDGTMAWMEDCHGDTYSVHPFDGALYTATHAHYCGNIGEFPQLNPWHVNHSLAFDKNPSDRLITPDVHGYRSFTGNPAGRLLHWYPDWATGKASGVGQAGWDITSSGDYLLYGGEFTAVNNVGQQGLVRFAKAENIDPKIGPSIKGGNYKIETRSIAGGQAQVLWDANYDPDDAELTYEVLRQGVSEPLYTTTSRSTFWIRDRMLFTDRGVASGQTYNYRVRVTDGHGNWTQSNWTPVTVSSSDVPFTSYSDSVLQSDPVHYWPLGEPSGETAYDWVGANDISLTQNAVRGQSGQVVVDGENSASTLFTGFTSFGAAAAAESGPDTFSVEAWFKTTSTSGGKIVGFGNSKSGLSTSYDRHIYLDSNGRVTFGVYPGSARTLSSDVGFNDGTWHHVVGTLGPDGMTLYMDGTRVGTSTETVSGQAYTGYWRVGGDQLSGWPNAGSSLYLAGDIADVAVYDEALTLGQVDTHWTASGRASNLSGFPEPSFETTVDNLDVQFDGSGSSDAEGAIASYAWDFGDGSTGEGATVSHSYSESGTYSVTLTVVDADGLSASVSHDVVVEAANSAPVAAFSAGTSGLTVSLDGTDSSDAEGAIASYAWDFGDGSTGVGATVGHTYDEPGTYTVTLTVTDADGETGSVTQSVTVEEIVNSVPVAVFSAEASGLTVSVDGSASSDVEGAIAGYAWDFGDGSQDVGASVSHEYAEAGTYTVTLTVTDSAGATASVTQSVTVEEPVGGGDAEVVVAEDDFDRTESGGWGTAEEGGSWRVSGGSSEFSVEDGVGLVAIGPSQTRDVALTEVNAESTVTEVTFASSEAMSGGASSVSVYARTVGSDSYSGRVRFADDGTMRLYLIHGNSSLGSVLLPGTYVPGEQLTMKFSLEGTSPTKLAVKAWRTAEEEPADWMVEATDSTPGLQTAGSSKIRISMAASSDATTEFRFYHFLITENTEGIAD